MRSFSSFCLLLVLPLVACGSLRAQTSPHLHEPAWAVGIRSGVNVVSESMDPNPIFQTLSGQTNILFGAELDYNLTSTFSLCLQPTYQQKGYHNVFALPSSLLNAATGGGGTTGGQQFNFSVTTDLNAHYLEVPLVLRVSFPSGGWRPYFFAGPSFGFLLSAKGVSNTSFSISGIPFPFSIDSTGDEKQQLTSTDISMCFGSGVAFQIPFGPTLYAEASYAFGLSNVWNNSHTGMLSNPLGGLGNLGALAGGGTGGTGTTPTLPLDFSQTEDVRSHDFRIVAGVSFTVDW